MHSLQKQSRSPGIETPINNGVIRSGFRRLRATGDRLTGGGLRALARRVAHHFSRNEKLVTASEGQSTNQSSGKLSPEFDAAHYRRLYSDLAQMSDGELYNHWVTFGISEGRVASSAATRENFVSSIPRGEPALEIGPFCNPCLVGEHVRYFDVLDKAGLVARANAIGSDNSRVPSIDFVSPDGDLSIVPGTFPNVFSSHCIEHQPDLVYHLNQVARLLRKSGFYFLIVPDKRYCFDHFLPESTIADVIDAYLVRRTAHTARSIIEHRALTTHNEPLRHWQGEHGIPSQDVGKIRAALVETESSQGKYVDVHAWQFTPRSFRTTMNTINDLGLAPLRPVRVYETPFGRCEFCAVLGSL